jgi:Helix-turn-helix domain
MDFLDRASSRSSNARPPASGVKSGPCFPSYERIAAAACCGRSTIYDAIRALEDAGILTWVNRIKRVRERCVDLLGDQGWRWRVLRTSNAYSFRDPSPSADRPNPFKSKTETGTENPVLDSSLFAAFDRLKEAIRRGVLPTVRVKCWASLRVEPSLGE